MADQALWWPRGASCCEWVKINLSLSLHTCAFLYGTISKGDMHTRSTAQVTTDCSVHPHGGVDLAALTSSFLCPRPLTPARGAVPCPPGLLAPAPAALSHGCIRLLKWASVFKGPHCLYTSLTSPVPKCSCPAAALSAVHGSPPLPVLMEHRAALRGCQHPCGLGLRLLLDTSWPRQTSSCVYHLPGEVLAPPCSW